MVFRTLAHEAVTLPSAYGYVRLGLSSGLARATCSVRSSSRTTHTLWWTDCWPVDVQRTVGRHRLLPALPSPLPPNPRPLPAPKHTRKHIRIQASCHGALRRLHLPVGHPDRARPHVHPSPHGPDPLPRLLPGRLFPPHRLLRRPHRGVRLPTAGNAIDGLLTLGKPPRAGWCERFRGPGGKAFFLFVGGGYPIGGCP